MRVFGPTLEQGRLQNESLVRAQCLAGSGVVSVRVRLVNKPDCLIQVKQAFRRNNRCGQFIGNWL